MFFVSLLLLLLVSVYRLYAISSEIFIHGSQHSESTALTRSIRTHSEIRTIHAQGKGKKMTILFWLKLDRYENNTQIYMQSIIKKR